MFSQVILKNTPKLDSIKISSKQLEKATEALIELRNLKKVSGITQQQLHNKDVVISYYERENKKLRDSDSLSDIVINNKLKELEIVDQQLSDCVYMRKQESKKKLGLAISLPLATVCSFLLGFYLHH